MTTYSGSTHGGHGTIEETPIEGDKMPTDALQNLGDQVRLHDTEPILERRTDVLGIVRIYSPACDPKDWKDHSFLITSEHDSSGEPPGISVRIKAKYVWEIWERPHFINEYMKFGTPDREESVEETKSSWNIEVPDRKVDNPKFTFDD